MTDGLARGGLEHVLGGGDDDHRHAAHLPHVAVPGDEVGHVEGRVGQALVRRVEPGVGAVVDRHGEHAGGGAAGMEHALDQRALGVEVVPGVVGDLDEGVPLLPEGALDVVPVEPRMEAVGADEVEGEEVSAVQVRRDEHRREPCAGVQSAGLAGDARLRDDVRERLRGGLVDAHELAAAAARVADGHGVRDRLRQVGRPAGEALDVGRGGRLLAPDGDRLVDHGQVRLGVDGQLARGVATADGARRPLRAPPLAELSTEIHADRYTTTPRGLL